MKQKSKDGFVLIYFLGYLFLQSLLIIAMIRLLFFYVSYVFCLQKNQDVLIAECVIEKKFEEDCLNICQVKIEDAKLYFDTTDGYIVWKLVGTMLARTEFNKYSEKKSTIYLCTPVQEFTPFIHKKNNKICDVGFTLLMHRTRIMVHRFCCQELA